MKYFRVKNWDRYQHYKDRCPPWIKLHRELLSSRTWVMLSDENKALAIACMLVAAATDNKVPADPAYVQRLAYLQKVPDFSALAATDFIEFIDETGAVLAIDSNTEPALAIRTTETEKKEKEEKSREERARAREPPPEGLDLEAWNRWESYRRAIGKPIKPASMQAAQRKLAGHGADQATVVEYSIAQGYQGLWEPKAGNGNSKPKLTWRPPDDDEDQPRA